jgi:hypothetical protein
MVTEMGEPVGMITPHEIKTIEPRLRAFKSAADVMRPLESLYTVTPQTPATEAASINCRSWRTANWKGSFPASRLSITFSLVAN